MTDRDNFERLRTEIQMLLTDYADYNDRHRGTLDRLDNAQFLYENIMLILNDSEHWDKD